MAKGPAFLFHKERRREKTRRNYWKGGPSLSALPSSASLSPKSPFSAFQSLIHLNLQCPGLQVGSWRGSEVWAKNSDLGFGSNSKLELLLRYYIWLLLCYFPIWREEKSEQWVVLPTKNPRSSNSGLWWKKVSFSWLNFSSIRWCSLMSAVLILLRSECLFFYPAFSLMQ